MKKVKNAFKIVLVAVVSLFLAFAFVVWGIPAAFHRWEAIKAWSRGPYNPFFILGSSYEEIIAEYGEPHLFFQGNKSHSWHSISEDHFYMAYAIDYREDHRAADDFWYICIHLNEKGKAYFVCAEWSIGGIARRNPLPEETRNFDAPPVVQEEKEVQTGWLIGCVAAGVLGIAAMTVPVFLRKRSEKKGKADSE